MKLTKLTARNLKGLSFTLDLNEINFLVGANFTGKTARTDAIALLLMGYLPELGKLPAATFGICSGKELIVEGEFDNGQRASRRWYLKGDSVKSESSLPPAFENADESLTVMMNAETYFGLSSNQRVAYVFANIPMGGEWTPMNVAERLAETVPMIKSVKKDQPVSLMDKVLKTLVASPEASPQTFVEMALVVIEAEGKLAKDHAAKMEKTAQGLLSLRHQDQPTHDIAALDLKREAIVREIETLQNEKASKMGIVNRDQQNNTRREQLAGMIRTKSSFIMTRDICSEKIRAIKAALEAIPVMQGTEIDALRREEKEATVVVSDLESKVRWTDAAIQTAQKNLDGISTQSSCPYCGAAGDGWKTLKTAELTTEIATHNEKKDQLMEALLAARNILNRTGNRLQTALKNLGDRAIESAKLPTAERQLSDAETQLTILAGKEEELAAIPANDEATLSAVVDLQLKIDTKNTDLRSVDELRKTALGRAHDLRRLAEAETQRDEGKNDEQVAKDAAKALREIKAEMVVDAFGPLLQVANSFFPKVLSTPLAYHNEEIGMWKNGSWVGHKTFSGLEKLICYAAIQAALASKSPVRLMILDEMLRAQNTEELRAFDLLVESCKDAVRNGKIEQFIGVIPGDFENYETLAEKDCAVVRIG